MKGFKLSILSVILGLAFASLAVAQSVNYPVNPNPTGLQTTPFSNNYFSASFNGPVTSAEIARSSTGSNWLYSSSSNGVDQSIQIRIVDHDIPVDVSSSNFYADNTINPGTITDRSTDVWEGHPFTYTRRTWTENGVITVARDRYIIVNSRTVIVIQEMSLENLDNRNQWLDFEYSLRIK